MTKPKHLEFIVTHTPAINGNKGAPPRLTIKGMLRNDGKQDTRVFTLIPELDQHYLDQDYSDDEGEEETIVTEWQNPLDATIIGCWYEEEAKGKYEWPPEYGMTLNQLINDIPAADLPAFYVAYSSMVTAYMEWLTATNQLTKEPSRKNPPTIKAIDGEQFFEDASQFDGSLFPTKIPVVIATGDEVIPVTCKPRVGQVGAYKSDPELWYTRWDKKDPPDFIKDAVIINADNA